MRQVLTRRSFLSRLERATLAVPALLLACSDDETPQPLVPAVQTAAPKRGGTLRIGQGSDLLPEVGHPFALVGQHRTLAYACNETPIQYDRDLTPTPLLAERF